MALYLSSIATKIGAIGLNRMHRVAAQQDLGGKVERLISNVNELAALVSAHNLYLLSANASAVGFSAISAGISTSPVAMTNFNASNW